MVSFGLPDLVDLKYLQQILDHAWSLTGVPCRIDPPPDQGTTAAYVQVPRPNEERPGLNSSFRWEKNTPPPGGEIQSPGGQRNYILPIVVHDTWIGTLVMGDYILFSDPHGEIDTAGLAQATGLTIDEARQHLDRVPRITSELRDRAADNQKTLVGFITALLDRSLSSLKTEHALAELERRYRGIFDGVQDGILFETHDGHILDANRSAASMHGYTRDEMLNLTVHDLSAPGRPIYNLDLENPLSKPIETQNKRKDGSVFPVTLSGHPLEIDGINFQLVVVRDITTRKQAEEAVGQSQERLELALEATEAGFWDWDLPSGFVYFSPRWFSMLGYRPDELPPSLDTLHRLLHPQDAGRANLILEQHLAGKRPFYEVEFRLRTKQGHWCWILSRGKVMRRDTAGKPLRMTGTHIDITLRKQSETALHSSEEKFYKAFQISPDAISISRAADAVYLDVNNGFATFSGYSREEIIGKNSDELGIWAYAEERAEMVHRLQAKGEVLGLEAAFRHKDGHTGVGLVAARAIDIDGVPCILSIVRDITDRKQADDLLRDAHIRLKWAYEATLLGWNKALEMRDVATRRHSDRCTELTLRLAQAAGIHNDEELTFINYGAILHDIGKLAIPDMILNKPTPLNTEEWNIMRRHPLYAQEMLQGIDYLHPVLPLVTSHHERWDGNGYPLGLMREEIPLEARIFAIVDVWDSMTTPRPYRPALSEITALAFIKDNAGFHFDPELVKLFLQMIAKP